MRPLSERWLQPAGLYVLALIAGALAAVQTTFPPTEVSAYVIGVARNLVEGHGLVSDAVWSYAVGPLAVPRPAFDLWQPLPGFLAAAGMVVLGPSLTAAQAATALLAATVAPLTWAVAVDAAARNGLEGRRATTVSVGAGLVAAVFGPFLLAIAGPDSTAPFTVFAVAACVAMPQALGGRAVAGLVLGVLLGLAYLSRQEAVWLGLAYLVLLLGTTERGRRSSGAWLGLRWPVLGGLVVALPWIARNAIVFDGGTLRQTLEIAVATRNEQIFAFADRATLAAFLADGPWAVAARIAEGLRHDLVDVLLVPAAPVGLVGLVALVALRRSPALQQASPLRALVIAGLLTFLVTSVVFPVSTLWGTYQHSAGPTLVALIVLAMLGLDAFIAWVGRRRGWSRENAWLAPLAMLVLVVPLAVLFVRLTGLAAEREETRQAVVAGAMAGVVAPGDLVITDHPMWLAEAADVRTAALPDEPAAAVASLADQLDAGWLLVLDERGDYPGRLLASPSSCFVPMPLDAAGAHLWRIEPGCAP
jgi:Dolichyl-phosphate-mannose-protein mannosyltransferase